jgi:hypothetical protein
LNPKLAGRELLKSNPASIIERYTPELGFEPRRGGYASPVLKTGTISQTLSLRR